MVSDWFLFCQRVCGACVMGSDCFYFAKVCGAYNMGSDWFYLVREYVVLIIWAQTGFTLSESMWCL